MITRQLTHWALSIICTISIKIEIKIEKVYDLSGGGKKNDILNENKNALTRFVTVRLIKNHGFFFLV